MQVLPIDPFLAAIREAVHQDGALVITAEPGAGKTTRVPPAFLADASGDIVVLEPRRLAARLSAERVADELGEKVGGRVGYEVRFDRKVGKSTQLRFITEGILTRRWSRDPTLRGTDMLIFDEFHERHLHGDMSLALARQLRDRRPELKIIVMSATLAAERVAEFLSCEVIAVPGRAFPVEVEHLKAPDKRPLERQVLSFAKRGFKEEPEGDVLVFLPGAREIRRASEAAAELGRSGLCEVHALHGDLPPQQQDKAVSRSKQRKLILSTNIAETSLTLPQVTCVVDSGLARSMVHSPFSGLPSLITGPISQASAKQRAGRAGRTRPGRCYRLYTEHDMRHRSEFETPEIARAELSELVLLLLSLGTDPSDFSFFERPKDAALSAARALLQALCATKDGVLTTVGQEMVRIPAHPRLARLLLDANERGVGDLGALAAALLHEREIRTAKMGHHNQDRDVEVGASDLLHRVEAFEEVERSSFSRDAIRYANLDIGAVHAVKRTRDQFLRQLPKAQTPTTALTEEDRLLRSILVAFSDRVGRRRGPRSKQVVFAKGAAELHSGSVVREAEFLAALEVDGRRGGELIRMASAIEPEWLIELFEDRLSEQDERIFDAKTETVLRRTSLAYEGLVIDASTEKAPPDEETAEILAQAVFDAGLGVVCDKEAVEVLVSRCRFASQHSSLVPDLGGETVRGLVAEVAIGSRSFAELRASSLLDLLFYQLPPDAKRALNTLAPPSVTLPGCPKGVPVHYKEDRAPYIESHLQDFFGLTEGPQLGGRPLVLHLLAPNRRAVQVTTDLAGFWERHYPELRRSLGRRYSRHYWPESPTTAKAVRFKRLANR